MSVFDFDRTGITVNVAGRTDVGQRRRENQDSFLVADLGAADGDGVLLEPDVQTGGAVAGLIELGSKGALCLVADGMGGAAAGGLASNVAVASIHDELRRNWTPDRVTTPQHFAQRLREAVEASNARIHETSLSDARYRGMGTTATAVGILETFLYVAQVGDSRAYLVRAGTAIQLTRDQSYIQHLVDTGSMTEEEAEQSDHRNMILQALGTSPYVDVEMTYQEVRRGDLVIVCSDGLSRVVTRDDLSDAVRRMTAPASLCEELVDLANLRGGPDNITVVAALFDGNGLAEPATGETPGHHVYRPDQGGATRIEG